MNKNKSFLNNLLYAFGAQTISLMSSLLMTLFVPRILGVEHFSFWQLFIFYSGYSGFFHLGLNDGIYLKIGGYNYKELDHSLLGSQFRLIMLFQAFITLLIVGSAYFLLADLNRSFVLTTAALYMLIFNAKGFLSFVLQGVNQIKIHAIAVMVDRVFFILAVLIGIIASVESFKFLIYFFMLSKVLALIYCVYHTKEIFFAKQLNFALALKETVLSIRIGIVLMIANIASLVILGSGRFIIDNVWGLTTFGKISLSLSLVGFFLLFIRQISMVLFPTLRQSSSEAQLKFYLRARNILSLGLPILFILYLPISRLLVWWLPQYTESFRYLILLLPICLYDGKMQMLCMTYFKVLREEAFLLRINIITAVFSIVLGFVSAFVIREMSAVVISMVLSIAFRSVISEIYLAKLMSQRVVKDLVQESMIVVIFVLSAWHLEAFRAVAIILLGYIVYLVVNREKLKI